MRTIPLAHMPFKAVHKKFQKLQDDFGYKIWEIMDIIINLHLVCIHSIVLGNSRQILKVSLKYVPIPLSLSSKFTLHRGDSYWARFPDLQIHVHNSNDLIHNSELSIIISADHRIGYFHNFHLKKKTLFFFRNLIAT